MESMKEKSLFGKACEEEGETKKRIGQEEGKDHVHVHTDFQKEDQLKSAKAKVGEIKEENERLKLVLAGMVKDYESLHTHFLNILQQEEAKKSKDTSAITHQENEEEPELVSLSLGRSANISSEPNNKDTKKISNLSPIHGLKEGLALGLDCKFEHNSTESEKNPSSGNTFKGLKEEEPTEIWPPSKILKTIRSDQDEEVLQQTQLKKARVSVRARCNTPTMNDGCVWRKYGQKITKANPCPRAYYRCTFSPNCPVRKQVQRWAEDMSILITTYEGTHNHPLPTSATAMASTTSAAASMLQCRSSTTQPGLGTSVSTASSTSNTANLHGLNFTFSETARPHQSYFPISSISNSNSHPTIVLDLTAPNSFSHFNRLSSASSYDSSPPCLNFSSLSSTNSLEPKILKTWSSGYSNHANYLAKQQPQEHNYQPYRPMNDLTTSQQSLTDTIAATTKVITSNTNLQSALAAAISSFIGYGGSKAQQNLGAESSGLDMKWGKSSGPINPADSSAQNGIGFATSFLNTVPSSTPRQPVSIFPLNSLPFSTPNSASGSPADVKDHA